MGGFKFATASVNCDGSRGLLLAALCAALLIPAALFPQLLPQLRYDRTALAAGEWWRLVSAHWVHLSVAHAALNACGLALLWMLFARDYRAAQWLLITLAACAAIDAGLWLCDPTLEWYVGASGVLHGILAAGVLAKLRDRQREGLVLGVCLIAKLLYEQLSGPMPFSSALGRVIVDAHLYGAVGGLAGALVAIIPLSPRQRMG